MREQKIQKAERLFQAMGHVEDKILQDSEVITGTLEVLNEKQRRGSFPKKKRDWKVVLLPTVTIVAACLALMVWWGDAVGQNEMIETEAGQQMLREILELRADEYEVESWELRVMKVPLKNRIASYHQVELLASADLGKYKSDMRLLKETENVYYLSGTGRYEYLIREEEDGSYGLWRFSDFVVWNEEEQKNVAEAIAEGNSAWNEVTWYRENLDVFPYSYEWVLEEIYGIDSAEDIKKIVVNPATIDSTDAGKKLQEEIGIVEITDPTDIKTIYQVLAERICLGRERWELIHPIDSSLTMKEQSHQRMLLDRYLTIYLDDSVETVIGSLKYTAVSGRFYESNGIAYDALSEEEVETMERIFQIEP